MKRWLSLALKLSITCGIVYYIFEHIPFSNVLFSITSARETHVLIALIISFLIPCVNAYQMKLLTDEQGMSFSTCKILEINLITKFYLMILPGGLPSAVIRWYKLSKPDKKGAEALASMTLARLVNTIMLVVLGISFWIFDKQAQFNYLIALGLVIFLFLLLLVYLIVFTETGSPILWWLQKRANPILMFELIRSKIGTLLVSFAQYHCLPVIAVIYIFALSLITQFLGILATYLLVLSLGMNLSIVSVGWIHSFTFIITMLPVSISGFGIREGSLILLLKPYGVSASDAVALSLLGFGISIFVGAVGGLLEAREVFLLKRRASRIKEMTP